MSSWTPPATRTGTVPDGAGRTIATSLRQGHDALEDLSVREREVLALMAEGRSNEVIAERLVVTERSVEKHVNGIFPSCGCRRAPRTTVACWPCWRTSAPSYLLLKKG